jgi:hypothetical protein
MTGMVGDPGDLSSQGEGKEVLEENGFGVVL